MGCSFLRPHLRQDLISAPICPYLATEPLGYVSRLVSDNAETGYALDSGSHYRLRLRSPTGPSEIARSSAHRSIGRRPDGLRKQGR